MKHFMDQKLTTILQQKWVSKMLGFDYTIVYKREKENLAALSRVYEKEGECACVLVSKCSWKEELRSSQS